VKKKELVHIYVPSLTGRVTVNLGLMLYSAAALSTMENHGFIYKPFLPKRLIPIDYARNVCVKMFLEDKAASRLFFIDDDMNPPPNWHELLSFNVPAVSALAVGWKPAQDGQLGTVYPTAFKLQDDGRYKGFAPPSLMPVTVDAVGTGCVVLTREIFEELPANPYQTQRNDDGSIRESEDVYFWRLANKAGYRPLLVPAIEFGHDHVTDLSEVRRYGQEAVERGAELMAKQLERESQVV
jgi:hypothetical protein